MLDEDDRTTVRRVRVPITEWDPWRQLEYALVNHLRQIPYAVAQVNSKKKIKEPAEVPGPETALERLRRQRRDAAMTDLERQLGL